MNIFDFIKSLHKHDYIIKKWRLVHYGCEPSTRELGCECRICRKRKVFHNIPRDKRWEGSNSQWFDNSLWDIHWEDKNN